MSNSGCGWKVFAVLVILALVIFGEPWVVMHAWGLIAVNMFGAPVMPYWTAFWGTLAVNTLFGHATNAAQTGLDRA